MKKQFRLYDVYRSAVINETDDIAGISRYRCRFTNDKHGICVQIVFSKEKVWSSEFSNDSDGEKLLKQFIRKVNRELGNCRKPGKKASERPKIR